MQGEGGMQGCTHAWSPPSPKLGAEVLLFPATRNGMKWKPLPNMTPLVRPVFAAVWLFSPPTPTSLCRGTVPNWSIFLLAFGGGVWRKTILYAIHNF